MEVLKEGFAELAFLIRQQVEGAPTGLGEREHPALDLTYKDTLAVVTARRWGGNHVPLCPCDAGIDLFLALKRQALSAHSFFVVAGWPVRLTNRHAWGAAALAWGVSCLSRDSRRTRLTAADFPITSEEDMEGASIPKGVALEPPPPIPLTS